MEGGGGGGGMVCKVLLGDGNENSAFAAAARWVAEDVCLAAPPEVFKRFFFTAELARLMRGAVGGPRVTANPSIYPVDAPFQLFVPLFTDDNGGGGGGGGVFRTITKRQSLLFTPHLHLDSFVFSSSTSRRSTLLHVALCTSVVCLMSSK